MSDASVTLDLDAREFDARLAAIERKVGQASKSMTSSFGGIGGALGGLGGFLSVGASAAAANGLIDYGAHVQDLHERFGVSTDAIQKFGNVAEKNGSSMESMTMGFNKLEIARSKAMSGDQAMADAFLKLGVSFADLQKLKPDELMMKLGSSAMNAAEMVKLLGKNSLELRTALAAMADGTAEFGHVIDKEMIEKLKKADDTLKTMWEDIRVLTTEGISGTIKEADTFGDRLAKSGRQAGAAFGTELAAGVAAAKNLLHGNLKEAGIDLKDIWTGHAALQGIQDSMIGKGKASASVEVGAAKKPTKRDFSTETDETFEQLQEASKLTLGELAGRDENDLDQATYRKKYIGGDISKARQAQSEKQLASDAAFAGNESDFNLHNKRFQGLTSGISSLKESEKNIGMKEMVQSIEKSAQTIATNTSKLEKPANR
jgi:hypothetical protein